jgi:hypothetical protein
VGGEASVRWLLRLCLRLRLLRRGWMGVSGDGGGFGVQRLVRVRPGTKEESGGLVILVLVLIRRRGACGQEEAGAVAGFHEEGCDRKQ